MTAEAYELHVGRYGDELAAGLVRVAGVERGARVLDVGCGTGKLTRALANAAGAENVRGIEPSEGFAEACRQRVPGAKVCIGAAEDLPFTDGEFDAALAQLVVPLMRDPARGVSEMARVTRPGGVVAACAWDDNRMPLLTSYWDAAVAAAPEVTEAWGVDGRVGYPDPGELRRLFAEAGLFEVATGELRTSAAYDGIGDLLVSFSNGAGKSGRLYLSLDDARRSSVRDGVARRLGNPAGPFTLEAVAWWVRGTAGP